MFVVSVVIAVWYDHALLVFLQRDDENAGFGGDGNGCGCCMMEPSI